MLTDCGAEKTGESGPVEAAIRYCFFIEIVSMFFRIRLPVTVAVPILTLMNEVQATMIGRVVQDQATHVCQADYGICIYLGNKVASARGFELIPRLEAFSKVSIYSATTIT
jgi:hypothetical protein